MIIVRFADDVVVGFQHRSDAERFHADLVERFAGFNLELQRREDPADRVRTVRRREPQAARPRRAETFSFLGFTHVCGKTRTGRFALRRKTIAKQMAAKLREVNALLMQRRHWPIPEQGVWLGSVVRGHIAYYAVPGNIHAVSAFRKQLTRHWGRALRRRSQRSPGDLGAHAPARRAMAPSRPRRASLAGRPFDATYPRQEPSALAVHAGICAGGRPQGRSLPRMVAEGVGDDRGGHLQDVLADRGGPAGDGGDAEVIDQRRERVGVHRLSGAAPGEQPA